MNQRGIKPSVSSSCTSKAYHNAWDAGSAKAILAAGAKAIATSSWSVAEAQGYHDGEVIGRLCPILFEDKPRQPQDADRILGRRASLIIDHLLQVSLQARHRIEDGVGHDSLWRDALQGA
jgi:hypothetical protein